MNSWIEICNVDDLQPDSGVCALVNGRQIALFYLTRLQAVFAIANFDPFSQANVLSRGMVGDVQGEPMVASPMYKQRFHLQTGICVEDETVKIASYPARIEADRVVIQLE